MSRWRLFEMTLTSENAYSLPSLKRNPGVIYSEGCANFVTAKSSDLIAIGTLGM